MDERRKLLLAKFLKETNLEKELAQDVLAGSDWKYDQAIASFKQMLRNNDRKLSFTSPPKAPSKVPFSAPSTVPSSSRQPVKTARSGQRSPVSPVGSSEGISPIHRGISRANLKAKNRAQKLEVPVVHADNDRARVDSGGYYFMLPNLHAQPPDLSKVIKRDLLDLLTMKHLHKAGCLNWWSSAGTCGPLYAMDTSGDGNCLLHAASLSIWGMHDRELTLRTALNKVLTDENFTVKLKKIQRRWKRQQIQVNRELGLEYTAQEWEDEWESVLRLSSASPRHQRSSGGTIKEASVQGSETTYESLEEIHVFVLAHILHRPIIAIGDKYLRDVHGEPLAPNTFGGVYLPLEAKPAECCRSPVVLAYDMSHFCPLLPMDTDKKNIPNVIPVTDSDRNLLRVQFAVDPGVGWKFDESKDIALELSVEENVALIQRYLDLVKVPISPKEATRQAGKLSARDVSSKEHILSVPLSNRRHPGYDDLIKNYLSDGRKKLAGSAGKSSPLDGPPSYRQATLPPSAKGPSKQQNGGTSRTTGGPRLAQSSTNGPPPYGYATISPSEGGPRVTRSSAGNGVQHSGNASPKHSENPRQAVREGPPAYSSITLPSRAKQSRTHTSIVPTSPKGTKPLPVPTGGPPPYNYAVSPERGEGPRTGPPKPVPRAHPSPPKPAPRSPQSLPSYDGTKRPQSGQPTKQRSPGGGHTKKTNDLFDFQVPKIPARLCRTQDCKSLGSEDSQFYCTRCWLKK